MADAFPDTPVAGPGENRGRGRRAPNFFPTSPCPVAATSSTSHASGGGFRSRNSSASAVFAPAPDTAGSSTGGGGGRHRHREAAVEVRSGRIDTLGWVSASWEPRRVVLLADGVMYVAPLGSNTAGGSKSRQQQQKRPQHQQVNGNYNSNASNNSIASTNQQLWSPLVKKLSWRSNDRGPGSAASTGGGGGGVPWGMDKASVGSTGSGGFGGGHSGGSMHLNQRLKGSGHHGRARTPVGEHYCSDVDDGIRAMSEDGGDGDDTRSVGTSVGSHLEYYPSNDGQVRTWYGVFAVVRVWMLWCWILCVQ